MSTTTVTFEDHASPATEATPRKGFWARLMEARELEARARMRPVLARMSDAQLADIGFKSDEIRAVRSGGEVSASYWS
jgi:uncharacterized protein YjiS (DUF1127 family)